MTASKMTPDPAPPTGEERERRHRRRFWRLLGLCGLVTIPLATVLGALSGFHEAGSAISVPAVALWLAVIASAAGFLFFTVRFFRSVDEVELAANLWGSTVGFYAYAVLLSCWWVLARFEAAPPVQHFAVFFASLFAGLLTYGWRKLRAR